MNEPVTKSARPRFSTLMLAAALTACGGGGIEPGEGNKPPSTDARGECIARPTYTEDVNTCAPLSTDYQPRVADSARDTWPACISDDNTYHRLYDSIATLGRVGAFEYIAETLWRGAKVPTVEDFTRARLRYTESEGLGSRVERREDIHYPAPPAPCNSSASIPTDFPDRCVGPAKLRPLINESFAAGMRGEAPRVNAARIEAALLWFLYVSPLSEVTSCTTKDADCDSAWAYYTGGTPREAPAGLARYVKELAPETHERVYDATLAVRCWRDLDRATPATRLELRDLARTQLDKAMLRGVVVIMRQRFQELSCTSGEAKETRWAFLKVLVPLLDREARTRDVAQANVLKDQMEKAGPDEVDVLAAVTALDALFSCP
ncbi:MAG TPA: hypothetical protein VF794_32675 [Archangium sp.]|uniref:hypothetical protein n=1 Tax=Archangium sp. TaxID=1872627 RepID=UPI002ED9BB3B